MSEKKSRCWTSSEKLRVELAGSVGVSKLCRREVITTQYKCVVGPRALEMAGRHKITSGRERCPSSKYP
jgi:hypothetical protein